MKCIQSWVGRYHYAIEIALPEGHKIRLTGSQPVSIAKQITVMYPVSFEGSTEVKKPESMTDEQCMSIWAKRGFGKLFQIIQAGQMAVIPPMAAGTDEDNYPYFLTAWKPSYEDLQALNRGEPIYVKTLSAGLPPMALFTLDENNQGNF